MGPNYVLNAIFIKYDKPGSVAHADCWKGYDGLQDLGFIHKTVNEGNQCRALGIAFQ